MISKLNVTQSILKPVYSGITIRLIFNLIKSPNNHIFFLQPVGALSLLSIFTYSILSLFGLNLSPQQAFFV